jgi:hypothetical protein
MWLRADGASFGGCRKPSRNCPKHHHEEHDMNRWDQFGPWWPLTLAPAFDLGAEWPAASSFAPPTAGLFLPERFNQPVVAPPLPSGDVSLAALGDGKVADVPVVTRDLFDLSGTTYPDLQNLFLWNKLLFEPRPLPSNPFFSSDSNLNPDRICSILPRWVRRKACQFYRHISVEPSVFKMT